MKHFISLLVTLLLAAAGATAQIKVSTPANQYAPTPKALEMIRSGLLPADLNSGSVCFEIPVYTVSDRDFTIPISLRYSSQGFQPARQSGDAGLHWSLQAGGVITREIVGVDDFLPNGFSGGIYADGDSTMYALGTLSITNGNYYLPLINSDGMETSSDTFHFSFLGHSGSFIIQYIGNQRVFSVYGTRGGKGGYKISYDSAYDSFTVMTGDGYQYQFGHGKVPSSDYAKEKR